MKLDLAAAPDGSPSLLPALLGIVVAVLLWVGGDELKGQLPEVQQRLRLASSMLSRGGTTEIAGAKAAAQTARDERAALEFRLQATEPEQVARARMIHGLRQLCTASGAGACSVRLADDTTGLRRGAASAPVAAGRETTLQELGIARTRAIVSGTFQTAELDKLIDAFANDATTRWRLNGVIVRNNTFELDVERHLIPPKSAASGKS